MFRGGDFESYFLRDGTRPYRFFYPDGEGCRGLCVPIPKRVPPPLMVVTVKCRGWGRLRHRLRDKIWFFVSPGMESGRKWVPPLRDAIRIVRLMTQGKWGRVSDPPPEYDPLRSSLLVNEDTSVSWEGHLVSTVSVFSSGDGDVVEVSSLSVQCSCFPRHWRGFLLINKPCLISFQVWSPWQSLFYLKQPLVNSHPSSRYYRFIWSTFESSLPSLSLSVFLRRTLVSSGVPDRLSRGDAFPGRCQSRLTPLLVSSDTPVKYEDPVFIIAFVDF